MSEPTFTIGLADLKTLANAVCDLDSLKPPLDVRMSERVSIAHGIIIRPLGEHAAAVYAPDDGSERAQEKVAA